MATTEVQAPSTDYAAVIEAYRTYPFTTDETYQVGSRSGCKISVDLA